MHLLITVAVVLQVISAVAIIVLVLLQHGKGADMARLRGVPPALFSGPQEAPTSFPVLLLLLPRFSSALHWR